MHAGPKDLTSQSEELINERKAKDEATLIDLEKLFAAREEGNLSQSSLTAVTQLLQAVPENYTLYNYRREILAHLLDTSGSFSELIVSELAFSTSVLQNDYKCYAAFVHRHWIYESLFKEAETNDADGSLSILLLRCVGRELSECKKLLKLDERNFHVWNYRRWVFEMKERASKLIQSERAEPKASHNSLFTAEELEDFEATTAKLHENFSNYSAWHQRSFVFQRALQRLSAKKEHLYPLNATLYRHLQEEVDLISQAIFCDPSDQSAWFYAPLVIKSYEEFYDAQGNLHGSSLSNPEFNGDLVDTLFSSVIDVMSEMNGTHSDCFLPYSFLMVELANLLEKAGCARSRARADRYCSWFVARIIKKEASEEEVPVCHFTTTLNWLGKHLIRMDPARSGMYNRLMKIEIACLY